MLVNAWSPADPHILDALRTAEVCDLRLIYDSSNYVFLASLVHPEYGTGLGVYKPRRGEQPLSDFPRGTLYQREIAAYECARLLGWDIVPPTVECEGPEGPGSLQVFIEHDPRQHYFALRSDTRYAEQFVRFAVFDLVANNADRKGGHLLLDGGGRVWGIDNGLCFHRVEKLRTVIWDYAGEPVPEAWLADIERMRDCLAARAPGTEALTARLQPGEADALVQRCTALLSHPVLPEMYPWRCVPWPLV